MTDRTPDRRQAPRRSRVEDHGIVVVRIRPGHEAALVDVSAGGTLIETMYRLLPGRAVELTMKTSTNATAVSGRVLRCAVANVHPSSVSYRGAIGFDRPLSWGSSSVADSGPMPLGDSRPGVHVRADATPQVI